MKLFPQHLKIPIVSFANASTLASRYLIESLQNPEQNSPLETINDTCHEVVIIMAELFNVIPKAAEQQSTNRHNVCRCGTQEVSAGPNQIATPLTHRYPTRHKQHQTPVPRVQTQKRNPSGPPRVAPREVPLVTQEEINHMVKTIPIATHNMATHVEDGPLPWYIFNVVVEQDTGAII